jgi:hypothetical protein
MTINDLGAIGDFVGAIAVVVTLIYLARQVQQANMLAKAQARQRMAEQAQEELYQWMNNPDLRVSFLAATKLSPEAQAKLHFFLLSAMRQREWEWFQYKDGVIGQDVYQAYHEVISLHLGIPRTRTWWRSVGRIGFNPTFVAEVDAFLENRPLVEKYYEDIRRFDAAETA